jgi:hypothetical protein
MTTIMYCFVILLTRPEVIFEWTMATIATIVTYFPIWYSMAAMMQNCEENVVKYWFEKLIKLWKKKIKKTKRARRKHSPIRYYVYGTKYRMARVV